MNKQSSIQSGKNRPLQQGKHKRKKQRKRNDVLHTGTSKSLVAVTRTQHLFIKGKKVKEGFALLRRGCVRHYITAFLKSGIGVAVFINPFSHSDRKIWKELKSSVCDG